MYLKKKSKDNAEAAKCLVEECFYYAPSVHCSYYSSLQLIRHILYSVYSIQYEDQYYQNSSGMPIDGHKFAIFKICDCLTNNEGISPSIVNKNRQIFLQLQKCRVKADYLNDDITESEAKMALNISNKLNEFFNTQYKIQ